MSFLCVRFIFLVYKSQFYLSKNLNLRSNQYNLRVLPPAPPSTSLTSSPSTEQNDFLSVPSSTPSVTPPLSLSPSFSPTMDRNDTSNSAPSVSPSLYSSQSSSPTTEQNEFTSDPGGTTSASNSSISFNDCVVTFLVSFLLTARLLAA